jgi:hypothetical protein
MKNLSNTLYRVANWKILLGLLLIYVFFAGYLLKNAGEKINELAGKTIDVIDLTVGFNPEKTLQMVADYGDNAREYYAQTELTTDIAYPIVYAFLFSIILSLLYRNKTYAPFPTLNIIPFFALIFDYLENFSIVYLLKNFPSQSHSVATFCEVAKLLKWLVLMAIIVLTLYGLIRLLLSRFSPKS